MQQRQKQGTAFNSPNICKINSSLFIRSTFLCLILYPIKAGLTIGHCADLLPGSVLLVCYLKKTDSPQSRAYGAFYCAVCVLPYIIIRRYIPQSTNNPVKALACWHDDTVRIHPILSVGDRAACLPALHHCRSAKRKSSPTSQQMSLLHRE